MFVKQTRIKPLSINIRLSSQSQANGTWRQLFFYVAALLSFLMLATTLSHTHTHQNIHTLILHCVTFMENNDRGAQTFCYMLHHNAIQRYIRCVFIDFSIQHWEQLILTIIAKGAVTETSWYLSQQSCQIFWMILCIKISRQRNFCN